MAETDMALADSGMAVRDTFRRSRRGEEHDFRLEL
jgi:hypothetical protein